MDLNNIHRLCNWLHKEIQQSGFFTNERCLATSVILKYFLETQGVEATLWQGSVHVATEGYFRLLAANEKQQFIQEKTSACEIERLKQTYGARYITILANEEVTCDSVPISNALFGHVSLLIKIGRGAQSQYGFIDPTCFQFARNEGVTIDCPDILLLIISRATYRKKLSIEHCHQGVHFRYDYCALNRLKHHPEMAQAQKYRKYISFLSARLNGK